MPRPSPQRRPPCATQNGVSLSEPISPELVLVSPELGRTARAALPARPWELLAPPREAWPKGGQGVSRRSQSPPPNARSTWWRVRVSGVLAALVSGVVLGVPAAFDLGQTPTLERLNAKAGSAGKAATPLPTVGARPVATRPRRPAFHPVATTARASSPVRKIARTAQQVTTTKRTLHATPLDVTSGLFDAGSVGRFLVVQRERTLRWFDVNACGLSGRVGPIAITRSRTYSFEGAVGAGRLAISGQFVAPDRSRGIVSGPTCTSRIRFGARR